MNIDYSKLGFRWKGLYNSNTNYANKDVIYKEGAAFYYDTTTETFKAFARGQIEATNKGDLVVNGITLNQAFADERLYVTNGSIQFRHPIDRNGTRCIELGGRGANHMGWETENNNQAMYFLMANGEVRSRGYDWDGQVGTGTNDQGKGYLIPNHINFPKGTPPIVKIFTTWRNLFMIDSQGQLWGVGRGVTIGVGDTQADTAVAVNISENSEIGNNKIVDFFSGSFFRYDAQQHFAIDENGRVYTWGYNYNGTGYCVSGLGITQTDAQRYTARLIPFTQDVPISKASSDGIQSSFLISTEGALYATGNTNRNFTGHPLEYWELITTQGPVKEVSANAVMDSGTSNRYFQHLLQQDGKLFIRGNGHLNTFGTNPDIAETNFIHNDDHLVGENISKAFFVSGNTPCIIAQKTNGNWLYQGQNWDYVSPTGGHITPTSPSDWDQAINTLPTQYCNSQTTIVHAFGQAIYGCVGFLNTTTGKLVIFGRNSIGIKGIGHTDNGFVGFTNPIGIAGGWSAPYNNQNAYSNDYVLLNKNIINFEFAGRARHDGTNAIYYNSCHVLTDEGDVYSWGDSYYALNNAYPTGDTYTPQRVLF